MCYKKTLLATVSAGAVAATMVVTAVTTIRAVTTVTAVTAVTATPAKVAAVGPMPQGWPVWATSGAYVVMVALVVAIGVACTILVRRLLGANDRKVSSPQPGKAAGADAAELVAHTNGREISLGPVSQVSRFTIGSGPLAIIPLTGAAVLGRHVAMQRDRGTFRVRNRSRRPITVNGVSVCGNGRCRVVLSAEIRINAGKTVLLRVRSNARIREFQSSYPRLHGHDSTRKKGAECHENRSRN